MKNKEKILELIFKQGKITSSEITSIIGVSRQYVNLVISESGVHISRSQARRILSGLEKFKIILLDFDNVPIIGQAFADEIYRVFHHQYPNIKIEEENMSESVHFMVERAKNEAKKSL
ncbi:MAG: hypothetical protein UT09_C0002G0021 [Parcubacteria group bacterium GW2011_GWF2_38_8]|nr:MAG: hypothetical protein UT09_C0002G0021 [Parcubacteria group bacterium GW2011_GWF2_38_8]